MSRKRKRAYEWMVEWGGQTVVVAAWVVVAAYVKVLQGGFRAVVVADPVSTETAIEVAPEDQEVALSNDVSDHL